MSEILVIDGIKIRNLEQSLLLSGLKFAKSGKECLVRHFVANNVKPARPTFTLSPVRIT